MYTAVYATITVPVAHLNEVQNQHLAIGSVGMLARFWPVATVVASGFRKPTAGNVLELSRDIWHLWEAI